MTDQRERVERLIEEALEAAAAQEALNEFYEKGGKTLDEIEQDLGRNNR